MTKCEWCGAEFADGGKFCPKCGKNAGPIVTPGTCPECGAINATSMSTCGNCGAALPEIKPEDLPSKVPARKCKWCGNEAEPGRDECHECSHRQADTTVGTIIRKPASGELAIGAVLLMIAGVLAIVQGFLYVFLESAIVSMDVSGYTGGVGCCGLIDVVFGLGAVGGGYFTYGRTKYPLALVGGVLGMLGLGFLVGGLLGLIGLILVSMNKQQFD